MSAHVLLDLLNELGGGGGEPFIAFSQRIKSNTSGTQMLYFYLSYDIKITSKSQKLHFIARFCHYVKQLCNGHNYIS